MIIPFIELFPGKSASRSQERTRGYILDGPPALSKRSGRDGLSGTATSFPPECPIPQMRQALSQRALLFTIAAASDGRKEHLMVSPCPGRERRPGAVPMATAPQRFSHKTGDVQNDTGCENGPGVARSPLSSRPAMHGLHARQPCKAHQRRKDDHGAHLPSVHTTSSHG